LNRNGAGDCVAQHRTACPSLIDIAIAYNALMVLDNKNENRAEMVTFHVSDRLALTTHLRP